MADCPRHPLLVLVDLWEYQCCGEPLRVGDELELHLCPIPPDRVWSRRLPAPPAWCATHHEPHDGPVRRVRAQVFRLWEGFCDLQPVPGGGWEPAPSSGSLRPILVMDPRRDTWEGDPDWDRPGLPPGRRRPRAAQAWIVLLDVLAELGEAGEQVPGP